MKTTAIHFPGSVYSLEGCPGRAFLRFTDYAKFALVNFFNKLVCRYVNQILI